MQSIPLAVLKREIVVRKRVGDQLHAIHTACGIETPIVAICDGQKIYCMQSIPLAVLKQHQVGECEQKIRLHAIHTACGIETALTNASAVATALHAIHTACGIETHLYAEKRLLRYYCMQSIPLAVLKLTPLRNPPVLLCHCMQSIPLAVLKRKDASSSHMTLPLHAIHTACGIETLQKVNGQLALPQLHAIHTACGIETPLGHGAFLPPYYCMQSIPLAVLKLKCVTFGVPLNGIACNPYRLRC